MHSGQFPVAQLGSTQYKIRATCECGINPAPLVALLKAAAPQYFKCESKCWEKVLSGGNDTRSVETLGWENK